MGYLVFFLIIGFANMMFVFAGFNWLEDAWSPLALWPMSFLAATATVMIILTGLNAPRKIREKRERENSER